MVLSAQHGVLFASGPALGWLDDHRAARLHAAVTRATRAVPAKTAAQCVAGAHVQLTRLTGPQGTAWLAHLQPTRAVEAAMPALLTPSQAEVIEWVLAGCTAVEIAGRLNKGVETVRSQIKQAYVRLGVRNRLELARTMPRRPV